LVGIHASRVLAFGLLFLLASTVFCAQSATDATGTKIGVINVQQAIATTSEGKQAAAELETQFAPAPTRNRIADQAGGRFAAAFEHRCHT
jgi:Skp family chaperone for outer membrane proteins